MRGGRSALLWVTALASCAGEEAAPRPGWTVDGLVAPVLLLAGVLYARGAWVLWRGRDLVHGLKGWQAWCFAAGWGTVVVALMSPLRGASEARLSAHVVQHELLVLGAAPLIALGRPLVPFLWAFPLEARRRLVAKTRTRSVVRAWRLVTHPLFIVLAHAVALWGWHVPVLLEAALRSAPLHALLHASLFFTAALLFQSLVFGRYARIGTGAAAGAVFVTALHSSLLGAGLTLARRALYPHYAQRGAEALGDQGLAGLLLGVPSGVVFTSLSVALLVKWRGAAQREARPSTVEQLPTRRGPTTKTGR